MKITKHYANAPKQKQASSKAKPEGDKSITRFSLKTQRYYHLLIAKYSDDTNEKHQGKEEKGKARCQFLYEHAGIKKQYIAQMRKERIEELKGKEMDNCTFKPNIRKEHHKAFHTITDASSIYERNVKWMKAKREAIIQTKRRHSIDGNAYTFAPHINDMSIEIFDEGKNVINNAENALFLRRQFNARNKKEQTMSNSTHQSQSLNCYSTYNSHKRRFSNEGVERFKTLLHQRIIDLD